MADITNEQRASYAAEALKVFARRTKIQDEEPSTQLGDLLADLMHWALYNDVDFDRALQTAIIHYEDEQEEEEGDQEEG